MAAGVEDIEVGFEEAMLCLPSHVFDEAILATGRNKNKDDVKYHYQSHRSKLPTEPFPPWRKMLGFGKKSKKISRNRELWDEKQASVDWRDILQEIKYIERDLDFLRGHSWDWINPDFFSFDMHVHHKHAKGSSRRRHHKPRHSGNWASGGPGMQAFFLDSGQKSCGTGVFLPQSAGTNFQSSRRPACSPVLLPSRVVQALNLNVHELGLQISPRRDPRNNISRGGELNSLMKKNGKDHVSKRCVVSQNENSSPEIFLPKEWTY